MALRRSQTKLLDKTDASPGKVTGLPGGDPLLCCIHFLSPLKITPQHKAVAYVGAGCHSRLTNRCGKQASPSCTEQNGGSKSRHNVSELLRLLGENTSMRAMAVPTNLPENETKETHRESRLCPSIVGATVASAIAPAPPTRERTRLRRTRSSVDAAWRRRPPSSPGSRQTRGISPVNSLSNQGAPEVVKMVVKVGVTVEAS